MLIIVVKKLHILFLRMMSKTNYLSRFKVLGLLAVGFCIGVTINQLGIVMENIHLDVKLVTSDHSSSPQSTLQELMKRLPHLSGSFVTSPYTVPNIVHYFWFVDNSTKMSFVNFMSVLSVFRIHRPDTIWFHCNRLPDASDVHWDQLWKSVPLKIIYHKQQTNKDVLESGLMLARDSAVVATLLEHGGIFINWNILVVQSLNPLRNYSTCFSKKLETDIILAGRNAMFLQLINSSLQSPSARLSNVVPSLYQQKPNLLHLEAVSDMLPSVFNGGAAWQSQYVIRIPADRQSDTPNTIRTGRDALSTAMRYIYFSSTEPPANM